MCMTVYQEPWWETSREREGERESSKHHIIHCVGRISSQQANGKAIKMSTYDDPTDNGHCPAEHFAIEEDDDAIVMLLINANRWVLRLSNVGSGNTVRTKNTLLRDVRHD